MMANLAKVITVTFCMVGGAILGTFYARSSLSNVGSVFDTFEDTGNYWLFSDKIGSPNASAIERARVALGGPLGLSASEVVYFVATQDNEGQSLTSSCTYQVSGKPIDTRWWSLTLYDSLTENYVPNSVNRSSWNSAAIPTSDNGDWTIAVSAKPEFPNWLPTQSEKEQAFELNLRIYNPSEKLRESLPQVELPNVERLSCS